MSNTIDPLTIVANALAVLAVASPPEAPKMPDRAGLPELPFGASVRDLATEDRVYQDPCLHVDMLYSMGRQGDFLYDVVIYLPNQDERGERGVFAASIPYTANGSFWAVDIYYFAPGPWCEHLDRLAARARPILDARTRTEACENFPSI